MSSLNQIFLFLALLSMGVYISSCATVGAMNKTDTRFLNHALWTDEPLGAPKAVVLMLHGLNLKPSKMDGWAQLLNSYDAKVMRFALYGHAGEPSHMALVKASRWREQFGHALKEARAEAKKLKVPLYFVGFSLGALVALEYLALLESKDASSFDKLVLIAPAIATPWYSQAAAALLSVFSKKLTLPSRSPKQYRANDGTTVAAYEALFELKKSLEHANFKNNNIKALVLIDKHDELVPSASIKKIIADHRLSQWELVVVNNRFAQKNYGFRHLMVDEESVGPELWSELSQRVTAYLGLKKI